MERFLPSLIFIRLLYNIGQHRTASEIPSRQCWRRLGSTIMPFCKTTSSLSFFLVRRTKRARIHTCVTEGAAALVYRGSRLRRSLTRVAN